LTVSPERVNQGGGETGILGSPDDGSLPKQGRVLANALIDLSMCDSIITPTCLRALYATPPGTLHHPNNTLGIVEFTPQAYLQSDLDLFFAEFEPRLVGKRPITSFVDNGVLQTDNKSFAFNGESALDLELTMALIYPQKVTLYQVGDEEQGASFNNLLEALDGSYCAYDGGRSKDPNIDGQYPDDIACGTAPLVNVLSSSYAYNEGDLHPRYQRRQCHEYMKLGLQGVSVVFPSGDFGVAGNKNQCFDPLTGAYQPSYEGGIFNPSFPASCPYVTAVGATQVLEGSSVRSGEVAVQKTIRSGGGFSNVFEMPAYQKKSLERYWRDFAPPYGQDRHNNSRATRGFPDVSANGANFATAVNGNFMLSFGTSGRLSWLPQLVMGRNILLERR
jgi:tripeptidyl-peptidase-1